MKQQVLLLLVFLLLASVSNADSDETRRKMSLAHKKEDYRNSGYFKKGRIVSKEEKLKMSILHKGKKLSEEIKIKMRKNHKGMLGKHHSEETKKRLSKFNKGKKLSKDHKRKISEAHKGEKSFMFGKNHSEETRQKMSKAQTKEKHSQWLGGKSFEPYSPDFNIGLKRLIRKRDNYRCQQCFRHENELFTKKGKPDKLNVHHINFVKTDNSLSNLICLCRSCHSQTNFKREDWTNYFQKRVMI